MCFFYVTEMICIMEIVLKGRRRWVVSLSHALALPPSYMCNNTNNKQKPIETKKQTNNEICCLELLLLLLLLLLLFLFY